MPGRKTPLITGQYYHVFNRGIDGRPTFETKYEFARAKELLRFYQWQQRTVRYSFYRDWNPQRQESHMQSIRSSGKLVDIICYCFMPNHFHLLLHQLTDGGISKFLSLFQNSYTRYFNTKHARVGPLFLNQFHAVLIENEFQLIHVNRYIHSNPFTSYVVDSVEGVASYKGSSLPEYLGLAKPAFCMKDSVLQSFKDIHSYKQFVLDQLDYQRHLASIRHLALE